MHHNVKTEKLQANWKHMQKWQRQAELFTFEASMFLILQHNTTSYVNGDRKWNI